MILSVQSTNLVFHCLLGRWISEQYAQSPSPKELEHNFIYRTLTHQPVLLSCLSMLIVTLPLIPFNVERENTFNIRKATYILRIRNQAKYKLELFVGNKRQKRHACRMKKRIEDGLCFLDNRMVEEKFSRRPLNFLGCPQSTVTKRLEKISPTFYYTVFMSLIRLGRSVVQYCKPSDFKKFSLFAKAISCPIKSLSLTPKF